MKKITKAQMLKCIRNSNGIVTKIQRKLIEEIGENVSWERLSNVVSPPEKGRAFYKIDLTFGASSVIIKETTRVVSATRLSCTVPSSLAVSMRTPAFFILDKI